MYCPFISSRQNASVESVQHLVLDEVDDTSRIVGKQEVMTQIVSWNYFRIARDPPETNSIHSARRS